MKGVGRVGPPKPEGATEVNVQNMYHGITEYITEVRTEVTRDA